MAARVREHEESAQLHWPVRKEASVEPGLAK